ncbi:MAG: RsmE family RNA methyltransferase [Bradymonadia bacterium]
MIRLLVKDINWQAAVHVLSPQQIRYCIQVHRLQSGSSITVSDGCGHSAQCLLEQNEGQWRLKRLSELHHENNIAPITVFFGVPKGDKLDRVVRQLSELGISELVLVKMERNVVVLDGSRRDKRLERLRRVATEAARQSERSSLLTITGPISFQDAIDMAQQQNRVFFCQPGAKTLIPTMATDTACAVFVGPEGGLSVTENQSLEAAGFLGINLGQTILRTETAAVVAATTVLCRLQRF